MTSQDSMIQLQIPITTTMNLWWTSLIRHPSHTIPQMIVQCLMGHVILKNVSAAHAMIITSVAKSNKQSMQSR